MTQVPRVQLLSREELSGYIQCAHRLDWRPAARGNARKRLVAEALDARCCLNPAWCEIDGTAFCRQHAYIELTTWVLAQQEDFSGHV